MSERAASGQEIRAVLAKWTAHDWRRSLALAGGLDGSIRRICGVPPHEPLVNNAGALAMPVLTRLGQLPFEELVEALAPLAVELEELLEQAASEGGRGVPAALDVLRAADAVGPGLASLARCRLGQLPMVQPMVRDRRNGTSNGTSNGTRNGTRKPADLKKQVTVLERLQPRVVAAGQQLAADAEQGRPARAEDLAVVNEWNDGLAAAASVAGVAAASLPSLRAVLAERALSASGGEAAFARLLQQIADTAVTEGARAVLAPVLDEARAAAAEPAGVDTGRRVAFRALHRLLTQPAWEVSDSDVEAVEEAFGRRVARVAVSEG